MTESARQAIAAADTPRLAAALKIRAPSRCTGMPRRRAFAWISTISSRGWTVPSQTAFSSAMSPVSGKWMSSSSRMRGSISAQVMALPRGQTVRSCTAESTAAPPTSCWTMCPSSDTITSWPGRQWVMMHTWLPKVPLGTKSAASRPVISAARASSRWMVGSSPMTSSPTSAVNMACRMAGVGRVTVSDRRSINRSVMVPPRKISLRDRLFQHNWAPIATPNRGGVAMGAVVNANVPGISRPGSRGAP